MSQVTIKDVAEYADVSPSTVSRVINDNSCISAETRQQVREAMKKLGYHPNEIARSLVNQKSRSLGLVLSRPADRAMANPFFPDIIRGIASETQAQQFQLVLTAAEDYDSERNEALRLLQNGSIAGLIVMAARVDDDLIRRLAEREYPFVLVGRSLDNDSISRVDNDNIRAARRMTELFIDRGYESIALLTGPENYVVSRDRQRGYRQALEEAGIEYVKELVYRADFTYDSGRRAADRMLAEAGEDIDGVFAVDDILAMAVMRSARDRGLNIPADIGVAGFNDAPLASLIEPALTTVEIPIVDMGRKAAELLLETIEEGGEAGDEHILPAEIKIRDSL